VKLVAEVGVGTVAAGVAKAHADVVLISGDDGGTGASPLTSIKHAGIPWELGLAETQQVLVMNDLRSRIRVQTDGKLQDRPRRGHRRAAGRRGVRLLHRAAGGLGCIMMRKCHLNTCPVGIATQDPELRKKFRARPSTSSTSSSSSPRRCARSWPSWASALRRDGGPRGHARDRARPPITGRPRGWTCRHPLQPARLPSRASRALRAGAGPRARPGARLQPDRHAREALEDGTRPWKSSCPSATRTAPWAPCSRARSRAATARPGLPDGHHPLPVQRLAGQSFGAFLAKGVTLELEGDANDYVGKGLSGGGSSSIRRRASTFVPEENILVGNVVLYGATSGEASSTAWPASASPSATPAPPRWSKAWATTAANT
jgi:glutamate synthase (NADPH/NADH) large chain